VSLLAVDFPDITVLGWTPTDQQWTAVIAVLAGAAAAVVFLTLWRKTRRAVLGAVVVAIAVFVWARYVR
jgi:hypothetical protein